MVGIFNDHVLSVTYCLERLKASGVSEQRGPRVDAWIRFFKDLDAFRGALSTNRGLFDRCPLRIRCEALRQHWRCPRALQHCCQLKLHLETFSEFLEGSSDAYLVGNDLTLADLYGVCGLAPVMALLPFDFPKVEDWLKRCLDHELFSEQHEIRDWLDDKPILWFQEDLEDFEARLEKKAAWIRLHMMVCDRELFLCMRHFASNRNYVINLGGGHPANRILTYVEVHCLPPTETVEVIGRMHRTLRRLRDDVSVLQTEVRMLRRTFGQALENLAANYEELAPLIGLVAPPHVQGDPHEAADAADRMFCRAEWSQVTHTLSDATLVTFMKGSSERSFVQRGEGSRVEVHKSPAQIVLCDLTVGCANLHAQALMSIRVLIFVLLCVTTDRKICIYDEEKELIEAPPPPPSAPLPPSQPAPLPPSPRQKAPPQKAAPRCSWYDQIPGWGTFLQKLGQASLSFAGAEYGLVFVAEQRWKRRTWRSVYAGPPRDLEDPVLADGFSPWSSESVALHAWRPLTVAESTTFQYWDLEILQVADDFIGLKKPPGLSYQGDLGLRTERDLGPARSPTLANFSSKNWWPWVLTASRAGSAIAWRHSAVGCRSMPKPVMPWRSSCNTDGKVKYSWKRLHLWRAVWESMSPVKVPWRCPCCHGKTPRAATWDPLPAPKMAWPRALPTRCPLRQVLKRFHVPNAGPVSFWPRSRWFSLVQIACHSDRICQVYAHMAFIGHPVVCEPKYNAMNFEDDSALLPRTFLHVLRVELPSFSCSCDLAPDLQVALLRLQSLALDTKVCQTWTSRLPGLPLLLSCRGSLPPDPEGPDQKFRSETSKQTGRCSCCGDLEEAQCCPVGMAALHWTLRPAKSQTEEVSWDSEPCRLWAFGVRGWIPFELRSNRWDDWSSRAPAPGGLSGETLPTWWKRHGIRWCWAHDGSRVNGWIELNDKGSLMSKWGTGFWQTVNGDEQGHFLVVGINNMSHLLYLKEEVFEVLVKRPSNAAEDWKVLYDVEPCCATRGWPARSGRMEKF
ncbi:unnamed protein product, partial [Cladocopium goreaui]